MRAALTHDWRALPHASERLRDDAAVVGLAVGSRGYSLKHASVRLRDDPSVVARALAQAPHALRFASDRLRRDPKLVALATLKLPAALGGGGKPGALRCALHPRAPLAARPCGGPRNGAGDARRRTADVAPASADTRAEARRRREGRTHAVCQCGGRATLDTL